MHNLTGVKPPTGPGTRLSFACISLPTSIARRERMAQQLNEIGVPWRFFDALSRPTEDLVLHEALWNVLNGCTLLGNELGCYASHYQLLKMHAERPNSDVLIILEDDAILDTLFFKDIEPVVKATERYGYVRLNAQMAANYSEVEILGRRRIIRYRWKVHGCLAYAVTPAMARKFVKHFKHVYRPIDIEIDRFWHHHVPILCLYQPVAIEASEPTGIPGRGFTVTGFERLLWKLNIRLEKFRCLLANIMYDLHLRRC
jgi:glycosyl transferase family 25